MNNEILFCGDTHGSHGHIIDAALKLKPMAVVLLGDMESPRPLHIELEPIRDIVWWITGNHDTDKPESWSHLVDSELADRCIDGRVVTLPDGTRLAGLGGVFRGKIWNPPHDPVHQSYDAWLDSLQPGWRKRPSMFASERLRHRSTIFPQPYRRLASERADILVTHEAPSTHPYGWEAIDELGQALGVKTALHGHQHDSPDYRAQWVALGFEAYGVGLRGITGRNGGVIVPGESDASA